MSGAAEGAIEAPSTFWRLSIALGGVVIGLGLVAGAVLAIILAGRHLPDLVNDLPDTRQSRDLSYWLSFFIIAGAAALAMRLFYSWKIIGARGAVAIAILAAGSQSIFGAYNETAGSWEMFSNILLSLILTGVGGFFMVRAGDFWQQRRWAFAWLMVLCWVISLSISWRTDSLQYTIVATRGIEAKADRDEIQDDRRDTKSDAKDQLDALQAERPALAQAETDALAAEAAALKALTDHNTKVSQEAANGHCGRKCQGLQAITPSLEATLTATQEAATRAGRSLAALDEKIAEAQASWRASTKSKPRSLEADEEADPYSQIRATTQHAWGNLFGQTIAFLDASTRVVDALFRALWLNVLATILPVLLPPVRGLPPGGLLTPWLQGSSLRQQIARLEKALEAARASDKPTEREEALIARAERAEGTERSMEALISDLRAQVARLKAKDDPVTRGGWETSDLTPENLKRLQERMKDNPDRHQWVMERIEPREVWKRAEAVFNGQTDLSPGYTLRAVNAWIKLANRYDEDHKVAQFENPARRSSNQPLINQSAT